MLMLNDQA